MSTYVTQVVLISSWNGLWNSFQTTWRKEIKDQLTRIDSMWTSDYISWRALQVSIIKKYISKKLGLFHSNPVRSSMSTTTTSTWKRSQTPQWRAWLFISDWKPLTISWTTLDIVQSSWTQLSSKAVKKVVSFYITLGTTLLPTTGNVRIRWQTNL